MKGCTKSVPLLGLTVALFGVRTRFLMRKHASHQAPNLGGVFVIEPARDEVSGPGHDRKVSAIQRGHDSQGVPGTTKSCDVIGSLDDAKTIPSVVGLRIDQDHSKRVEPRLTGHERRGPDGIPSHGSFGVGWEMSKDDRRLGASDRINGGVLESS